MSQLSTEPKWHDNPPEPGLYYQETCDWQGNPQPGLALWEPDKMWTPSMIPTKYFGPIPAALKPWPMVPKMATKENS